jgi:hypothetical protein
VEATGAGWQIGDRHDRHWRERGIRFEWGKAYLLILYEG